MISQLPEQVDPEFSQEEAVEETPVPQVSNLPDFLIERADTQSEELNKVSDAKAEAKKEVTPPPKDKIKIGEQEYDLETEVAFDENLKAPLKHVKEQYTALRSRYGELGQKEEAARQRAAQLERDQQLLARERAEFDEIKQILSSGDKKEAIDKFFMKAGINPATWWPQFFDETAHIYEQRSQMDDTEKRLSTLQAENEILKKKIETVDKTEGSKKEIESLATELSSAATRAGLELDDVNNILTQINTVNGKLAQGDVANLSNQAVNFVKTFNAAKPHAQIQMLVQEAAVAKGTALAVGIAQELDSELIKDDNVIADLRAQILNPYRNPKMTREDFKEYLKVKWSSKLNGSQKQVPAGDGVQAVAKKEEPKATKKTELEPLSMWDLIKR